MKRSLRIITSVLLLLALVTGQWGTSDATVSAQTRLRRAPERDLESTQPLPPGTKVIPQGWLITLEMETPLSSATARISDKFRARVVPAVRDNNGKALIEENTYVEGHVSAVSKAKWAHRSGFIALVFDNFRTSTNKVAPVRATLTSADASDRKRIDDEGTFKGGNPTKRDVIFIGGGAGAGAAIGVFTGGALLGGGIGAAAGLTATLLLKGKDAVIKRGDPFAMELVQPLTLSALTSPPNFTATGGQGGPRPPGGSGSVLLPGALNPADITAERGQDGSVRLRINAETPSPGWRVYTHHDLLGSVARVQLRGTPPGRGTNSSLYQTPSIAPAPEICLNDRSGTLRRAEVLGKNGAVRVAVDIPLQPGSRFARAVARPAVATPVAPYPTANPPYYNPEIGRPTTTPPISSASPTNTQVQNIINQIDVIRLQYASDIGYFREPDGSFRFIGQRPPTQDQKQLLDSFGALLTSLTNLRANTSNPYTQRTSAQKVQEDARNTQQIQMRVPLSADLNRRWATAYQGITTLLNSTLR